MIAQCLHLDEDLFVTNHNIIRRLITTGSFVSQFDKICKLAFVCFVLAALQKRLKKEKKTRRRLEEQLQRAAAAAVAAVDGHHGGPPRGRYMLPSAGGGRVLPSPGSAGHAGEHGRDDVPAKYNAERMSGWYFNVTIYCDNSIIRFVSQFL